MKKELNSEVIFKRINLWILQDLIKVEQKDCKVLSVLFQGISSNDEDLERFRRDQEETHTKRERHAAGALKYSSRKDRNYESFQAEDSRGTQI